MIPPEESAATPSVSGWVTKPFVREQLPQALLVALGRGGAPLVLLVEEDPALGQALVAGLEEHGLRVRRTAPGPSALAALREEEPDLVMLDPGPPSNEGAMLVDELLRSNRLAELPVLVYDAAELAANAAVGPNGHHDTTGSAPVAVDRLQGRVLGLLRRITHAGG